ncbi:hypothetical protein SAMN05428954_4301 [Streptomyces sp. 2112.3]|uniref:hypothetical protein n=1 Tax=Streptomyces sp. 2112.3 TaxID=1881023 RepID=UPI000896BD2E|nr:hypothetical protein [Streptomyces sp. 2112.3]SEE87914.1 hypothetical protein SAMN05428954_4301 [Streptomyces sp. 2112.3]
MISVHLLQTSRPAPPPTRLGMWYLVPGLALLAVLAGYVILANGVNPVVVIVLGILAATFLVFAHSGPIQEISTDLKSLKVKFQKQIQGQQEQIKGQEEEINGLGDQVGILKLVVRGLVTRHMLSHLNKIAGLQDDYVRFEWSMYNELEHLDAMDYVAPHNGTGLQAMRNDHGHPGSELRLKDYLDITPEGLKYLDAWGQVSKE